MLWVREEACRAAAYGGQLPRGAIALIMGRARIDRHRCSQCGQGLEVWPQGAIVPSVPVSPLGLKATVDS